MEIHFPLILDGATGTELQKRGFDGSQCPEVWIQAHPQAILDVQRQYLQAGSDIVFAATFTASSVKLEEYKLFNKVEEFNKNLVRISRDAFGKEVPLGGDMSALGKFLAPLGDMTFREMVEVYKEQAQALEAAGVDFFIIETMMTLPEMRAALLAVKEVSQRPVFLTATCNQKGKTLTGSDVTALLVTLQSMGADAFGLNCSVGTEDMAVQLKRLSEFAQVPLIAKPNAGMPKVVDGKTVYGQSPEDFAAHIQDFADCGVNIFGGCCGSGPEHIAAIKMALEGVPMKKPSPLHSDKLIAATEKEVFVLEPEIPYTNALTCREGLAEDIEEACECSPVVAVRIQSEADLDWFALSQYAVSKPLFLVCDDARLLEEALFLYQGRALYDGSLPEEVLAPLAEKYGLIY